MELNIQFSRSPITVDDLLVFEKHNAITLPDDYKCFLLKHNGAVFQFDYPAYSIIGHKRHSEGLLQCLFCVHHGDPIDLQHILDVHLGRLPVGFIPIGSDPGNNLICICTSGDRVGELYFWERTKEQTPPTLDNLYFLAENFTVFLEGLYPNDC